MDGKIWLHGVESRITGFNEVEILSRRMTFVARVTGHEVVKIWAKVSDHDRTLTKTCY